jgi:hypothetical protein
MIMKQAIAVIEKGIELVEESGILSFTFVVIKLMATLDYM